MVNDCENRDKYLADENKEMYAPESKQTNNEKKQTQTTSQI